MRVKVSVVLVVLAASLGSAVNAHAQTAKPAKVAAPAKPLAQTLSGEAKAQYESGKLLFRDGDYAGALVKFSSAHESSKDARLLWNMAACEKSLRRYSRALKLVRQYLAEGGTLLSAQDRAEANELVEVMEPLTAKLRVTVDEPDSEISIDDEAVGTSPIEPVVVDIGSRKVRVRKSGFEEVTKVMPVGGAAEVTLDVKMVRTVHEGRLVVRAPEDATIAIDGEVVGAGTWSGTLPSGGHTLRVTAPSKQPYQSEVLIQDRATREIGVTLDREPGKGLPAWAWVAGGVVVAGGLGTAGYLLFRTESTYQGPAGNLQPGVVQASRPITF